jgi:hypothetical protein
MIEAMKGTGIADRQFTIEFYLDRSDRPTLPLGLGFAQGRSENNRPGPGPLAELVRRGRETALEQYLLLHAIASDGTEGFNVRLPAATWGRAIGGWFDPESGRVEEAALHAVSRNWKLLRELQLVETARAGRQVRATLLADDGSGTPYRHVGAGKKDKKLEGPGYFQLPYAYWRDRWHERLSLSAKAMLLVALYPGNGFPLPYNKVPKWYGISEATAERGLGELVEKGLLHREQHRRPDAESPVGFTDANYYELLPPFGPRDVLSRSAHPQWAGAKPGKKRKGAVRRGKKGKPKRPKAKAKR